MLQQSSYAIQTMYHIHKNKYLMYDTLISQARDGGDSHSLFKWTQIIESIRARPNIKVTKTKCDRTIILEDHGVYFTSAHTLIGTSECSIDRLIDRCVLREIHV